MERKQFKAESQRLLDLMINSIYTHREIFLRELISNASDAIDKIYYKALVEDELEFNQQDYYIQVEVKPEERQIIIRDTGIGMTREELEENLGVIAKSGSFQFKKENEAKDGHDIIGQFGVGFYSAFLVADEVTVYTKALGAEEGYKWNSKGKEGYTVESWTKESVGTEIVLHIKESSEEEDYEQYLNQYQINRLIKKYSDFIRYPIKMEMTSSKPKEGTEGEFEEVINEVTVNSMVPIWRKNKNELTKEDYDNFYKEKRFGFDQPLAHIHSSVDGAVSYNAILFIPERIPYDFYTKEYEKGLELYSSGVLIMEKCSDLLPDYFGFVKGVVDSEDLSLNISREMLQHDRQLKRIAKNIKSKIKSELEKMLANERKQYEEFYHAFGLQLKYGLYSEYGANRETLQDLVMFTSSKETELVTLAEYVERMPEDQKYIYYATGESVERIERLPQVEPILDKGYEVLYLTEEIDEFAIGMLRSYQEKEFKSVSSADLGIEEENKEAEEISSQEQELLDWMNNHLGEKVQKVEISKRLKSHPVCLSNKGNLTIEMEKVLNAMPNDQKVKAEKVLELNRNHEVFAALQQYFEQDQERLGMYTELLYNQSLLIEGLPIEDPVVFANQICQIMK